MTTNPELSIQDLVEGVFAGHDFIGEIAGREYSVQTAEVSRDGDVSIIEVQVAPNPVTDESGDGDTFHFRVEPHPRP